MAIVLTPQTTPAQDLYAHYTFDGHTRDVAGRQPDAKPHGTQFTEDPFGRPNSAIQLNGTNEYLNVGNTLKPNFPITVVAIVKGAGALMANDQVNSGAYRHGFAIGWDLSSTAVNFFSGYASPDTRTAQAPRDFGGVDPSKWLFLCVVMHSATDTDWYIDGKYYKGVRITDGRGTSMNYSNASGTIGASIPHGGYFKGAIDELWVYGGKALSADQIDGHNNLKPIMLEFPKSVNLLIGSSHTFRTLATSPVPFNYQWYQRIGGADLPIHLATNETLTIANASPFHQGQYLVKATNEYGTTSSPPFRVHVSEIIPEVAELLAISFPTSHGTNYDILSTYQIEDRQVTNGSVAMECGRFVNWTTAISNLVGTGAIVQAMVPTQTPYLFFKLFEHAGERSDMPACVEPPAESLTIESQPADQQIPVGGTARFSVGVQSPASVSYQWYGASGVQLPEDGVFFTGTKTCTLTVHHPDLFMAGDYWVVVSSQGSTITSNPARLEIMEFLARASRNARISFEADPGANYQLQFSDNLDEAAWTNWGTQINATGSEVTLDYTNAMPRRLWFRADRVP